MGVYKTNFCKIGYNPEITTSTDPEDVCTGLGLNGGGTYVFPTKFPSEFVASSVYTRTYFISSSSESDIAYHEYVDPSDKYNEDTTILINENQHGSVGAIEVLISGLNSKFGITKEVVKLNGQSPIKLANHYHRINEMKVVTNGRLLSNQGDIYLTAIDGVRTSTLTSITEFISSGVPISSQYTYAKIGAGDGRMLSSHYTVPRSHTLYIESIRLMIDSGSDYVKWRLKAGVNGALQTIVKGRVQTAFDSDTLVFKQPYTFPGGSDIKITIDTVEDTTDIMSLMEGYLISQEKLTTENEQRKLIGTSAVITRNEELAEETYIEDDYTDQEFYDVPDYSQSGDAEYDYDAVKEAATLDNDEEVYEGECEEGYVWCVGLRECLGIDEECK